MVIVYHKDGTKTVHDKGHFKRFDNDGLPFNEKMLRNYYSLECEGKLGPRTNKSKIKRTWELDGARREARIGEYANG